VTTGKDEEDTNELELKIPLEYTVADGETVLEDRTADVEAVAHV
jgi:hypothetical protein